MVDWFKGRELPRSEKHGSKDQKPGDRSFVVKLIIIKKKKKTKKKKKKKEELKSIFDPFYQAFSTHEMIITCVAYFTDKKTRHEYFFRFQIKSTQYKV